MTSDDDECGNDLNYGIEDEFGKSFGKNNHDGKFQLNQFLF